MDKKLCQTIKVIQSTKIHRKVVNPLKITLTQKLYLILQTTSKGKNPNKDCNHKSRIIFKKKLLPLLLPRFQKNIYNILRRYVKKTKLIFKHKIENG